MSEWYLSQLQLDHPVHGTFFVTVLGGGFFRASRVSGVHPDFQVEALCDDKGCADVDDAKRRCEARIAELDRAATTSLPEEAT